MTVSPQKQLVCRCGRSGIGLRVALLLPRETPKRARVVLNAVTCPVLVIPLGNR